MILSGRTFLLCVLTGVALGVGLIVTHTAPGLKTLAAEDTSKHRNEMRRNDLKYLYEALANYKRDHGKLPIEISSVPAQICTSYGDSCTKSKFVDLNFLITGGNYIEAMPMDPLDTRIRWASGYYIAKQEDGAIKLSAARAEDGVPIEIPE